MSCRKVGVPGNHMFSKVSQIQDKYRVFSPYPQNLDLKLNMHVYIYKCVCRPQN